MGLELPECCILDIDLDCDVPAPVDMTSSCSSSYCHSLLPLFLSYHALLLCVFHAVLLWALKDDVLTSGLFCIFRPFRARDPERQKKKLSNMTTFFRLGGSR